MQSKEIRVFGLSTLVVFDKNHTDVVHESGAVLKFNEHCPKVYELSWNGKFQIVVLLNSITERDLIVAAWQAFSKMLKHMDADGNICSYVNAANFYLSYTQMREAADQIYIAENAFAETVYAFDYDEFNRS